MVKTKKSKWDNWTEKDYQKEIDSLRKKKTYGLVWEEDKNKEVFDYYINWDGEKTKESFGDEDNKFPVLKEIKGKSIDNGDPKYNLMIEGDNYHSLAVLNFTHNKAIDVIYIDPPYNTGNEDFKYNDKFVDKDDLYKHSKWLSFMSKRLKLAKRLLKETGAIFISIDDNEFAQLKILCDEIFGEQNKLSTHHLQVRYSNKSLNEDNDWQPVMEYVLIYAKNKYLFKANKPSENYNIEKFKYTIKELTNGNVINVGNKKVTIFKEGAWKIIEEEKGRVGLLKETWASGSLVKQSGTAAEFLSKHLIQRKDKDGLNVLYKIDNMGEDGLGHRYVTGPKKANAIRGKYYSGVPIERIREINKNGVAIKKRPISNYHDYSGDFGNIRHEGGVAFNSGKKPIKMLKEFINYHTKKDALILDFFAGSGTTGHAVMDLNRDDKGQRKFILCTNNENNISTDICYLRIKKVIEGYNKLEGYKDNFKYFKTDFVDSAPTDQNKKKIVDKSTEMLCIKENAFKLLKDKQGYKIFKNTDIHLGIIFDEEEINDFIKDAKEIEGKFHVYVFSLDNSIPEKEFKVMKGKVKLCAIPEAILHVYRRTFK